MSPIPNQVINAVYLMGRDILDDATGKSSGGLWRLWDSCMDNTACKVVAIILIVIAALIVLWVLGTIFRCFYYGLACGEACCSCCCCGLKKLSQDNYPPQYYEKPATLVYANPNMYPAQQPPMYPPQYHQQQQNPGNGYNYFNQNQGYEPMYPNDENPTYSNNKYRQAF